MIQRLVEVWDIVSGNRLRKDLKRIEKAADKIIKNGNGKTPGGKLKVAKPSN